MAAPHITIVAQTKHTDIMKVFLSVGSTYSETQERFVNAFELFLSQNGCERLTVGRGNYGAQQPILRARDLMENADAVVVLAFTRLRVEDATEKPGSAEEKKIRNVKYPTIWNQLEAAMAFGLNVPILVIVEEGLHQEAMLKDRLEFRALTTALDPAFFGRDEFKGVFADFKRIAVARARENARKPVSAASLTVAELLRDLRPDQLWKVGAAVIGVLSALAGGFFWIGKHLG